MKSSYNLYIGKEVFHMSHFNLESYLTKGVVGIVKNIVKASAKNPEQSIYMISYLVHNKEANKKRREFEERGEHIPPFLIASITSKCNLHCHGCYARANKSCTDGENCSQMTDKQWKNVFDQAAELGISFVLLAGGEPLLRRDVLEVASAQKKILFPIFTNGTLLTKDYISFLSRRPNLLPVLSIEGNEETTDCRRGDGVYERLKAAMMELKKKGIVFGASVTVTKKNLKEVMGDEFLNSIQEFGAKAVVYVEYVPADEATREIALDDEARDNMQLMLEQVRMIHNGMFFVAFPGDEKTSGGCLAAGSGFFHINANGGAEPCPFSPYSDTNVKEVSLKEALHSKLFTALRNSGTLLAEHTGGCVLFEQEEKVKELLEE